MFWSKNEKQNFKVLSISGGTQKGFVSLIIAIKLESELKKLNPNKEFIEYFNTIIAVSSGSLIASCLVIPSEKNPKKPKYSLSECYKSFNQGSNILNKEITHWNKFLVYAGLKNSVISTDDFAKKLTEGLSLDQNYKLSQAVIPINIISYDIDNDKPRICSTYEAKKDPKKDFNLKDAFLASIALPPYFLKKTTHSKHGEKLHDYDEGIIHPSPIIISLPYIAKENNLERNDINIISIGVSISKTKDVLKNLDDQYIIYKAIDYINISQQITKPPFDDFSKYIYKGFYKLDLTVPIGIQQSFYNQNNRKDMDNYNKMIACTLKYIDKNENF
ncbi:patatin-like phospholipase family protein [Candidatus Aquarickettsia rohweri]|uniref:PNPLA domain-containing protein n=1 Tax=Candidatus Aquarickettsia rohweri TaxID=2602574 RepID=A0A429XSJ8_9RICK|nr:patatin-like phospholipase family protein [Candidatus Aquarickettsia rohweri]RST69958.1 hypothetical protein EIC27_02235 [Candidatus Aquarickettsia rohweri]